MSNTQFNHPPQAVQLPQPMAYQDHQANQNIKQGRDRAVYTRQQKGHSVIKHVVFGGFALWIPTIYYIVSPNHYWHA